MIGMTKWTPTQTTFIPFMSDEWFAFTNRIWYGELEYFFTTLCGLFVGVTIYYGYSREVYAMTSNLEEKASSDTDQHRLDPIGEVQSLFLKSVYPELYSVSHVLEPSKDRGSQSPKYYPATDAQFRKRRLERM